MDKEVAVIKESTAIAETHIQQPMTIDELEAQVRLVQGAMRRLMKEGFHFGVIPGCGKKPSLLKPGAELLSALFRLGVEYTVEEKDLPGGHKEYRITSTLYQLPNKIFIGQGVGSCSTMESKYQFRWENTGEKLPKEYWEDHDNQAIGGDQFAPRKTSKGWKIFKKKEHDNPADYYNTALKIGKKRAHVDAILTATAASDIFTQDEEPVTEPEKKPLETTPEQMTIQQRRKLYGMIKDEGYVVDDTNKGDVHLMIGWHLGRHITSTKEVTKNEASSLLDALGRDSLLADYLVRLEARKQ